MKKARSEACGCPRTFEFDPEIRISFLPKKVARGIKRDGKKSWTGIRLRQNVPKDLESEQRKIAKPERAKRMERRDLGYQVAQGPLATGPA